MPTPKSQAVSVITKAPERMVIFPEMYTIVHAGDGKVCKGKPLYNEDEVKERIKIRLTGMEVKFSDEQLAALLAPCLNLVTSNSYAPALSVEDAKELLHWEEETAYTKRMMSENAKLKEKDAVFAEFAFKDVNGVKINCYNNAKNRPFDESLAYKYAQEILNGEWAPEGPNGETIIIGLTGLVLSGQHRLIGLVLAEQMRLNSTELQKRWPNPLTMDSAVAFGVSENRRSVSTLDNVRPRSLLDIYYTGDAYRGLTNHQRKEICRNLDYATDFLWLRTGQGKAEGHKYQTHRESESFLERHPKLFDAVKWIFDHNQDHQISKLKISAGQCAACLYLMGQSKSAGPVYHGQQLPSEKGLDWSLWEKACKFWKDVSKGHLGAIHSSFGSATDDAAKLSTWKQVLLAKAWALYSAGKDVTVDSIQPEQVVDTDNGIQVRHLAEWPGFGGIDLGPKKTTTESSDPEQQPSPAAPPTRPTVENLQQKIDAAKLGDAGKKKAPNGKAKAPKARTPAQAAAATK